MPVQFDAIAQILQTARREGRKSLHEHEVYALVQASGAVRVPQTVFRRAGESFGEADLERMPGEQVVLKIVSPDLAHKSDIGGVRFVPRDIAEVRRVADELLAIARLHGAEPAGIVACEHFHHGQASLGNELFVGIRASREFGPIIAAGLGGVHTEYLASVVQKGKAVATALIENTTAEKFFAQFRRTMAYDVLAGRARGYKRIIADETLLECFSAFIDVAHRFCDDARTDGPLIAELEVNPFFLEEGHMVPLDGLCSLREARAVPPFRPIAAIGKLLRPKSMAIVGVSSKTNNMGRVILQNVLRCGFERTKLYVIKPGDKEIDGVACVESLAALPRKVDVLVVAVGADQAPAICEEAIAGERAEAVILVPGGLGETQSGRAAEERIRTRIAEARRSNPSRDPVFLGGNCLGLMSRPGHYDTMFIPAEKLAKRWDKPGKRVAVISQSGAYAITRLSNLETLDPDYAISMGNQTDLTLSDMLRYLDEHSDVGVFGIYAEGFRDLDGLEMSKAVARAVSRGKDVIFYKAGRTEAGRAATAGHTASIAGDYNVCEAAMSAAGALVADGFKEFEYLLQLAAHLHGRVFTGRRIGGVSNAGYEVVGMADATVGPNHHVEFGRLRDEDLAELRTILSRYHLESLVNLSNPLDLTPMAPDAAHEEAVRLMLECPGIDAVVASFVPLTPAMKTTQEEIADASSLAQKLPRIFRETSKPLVVVIDSGPPYDPLAQRIREGGVPVFRSADSAVRALARYICHRTSEPRAPARDRHEVDSA